MPSRVLGGAHLDRHSLPGRHRHCRQTYGLRLPQNRRPAERKSIMNTKFFIGFATLNEFLSHKPRVVYYSLSSKTHTSNKSNFSLTTWECELMLQYFPFFGDEDQRV